MGVKIILVEDSATVALSIRNCLMKMGYDVPSVVSYGEEAVAQVEEHKPDLVLMDIILKGEMDGIEAASQIRSRFNIPVIYLTAFSDTEIMERAKITEPFGYVIKPYQEKELYTIIEMALYKNRMDRKLKESEEWLSATLRSIGDGVIAIDTDGIVKFINPVAEKITCRKSEEAVGKPLKEIFNIISEENIDKVKGLLAKKHRRGACPFLPGTAEFRYRQENGRYIWLETINNPVFDKQGFVNGIVFNIRDISERKHLEEEQQKADKLESLGILAGGIAHDFNNLLTVILGNVSLASRYSEKHEKILRRLKEAEKAIDQARGLTQQLLTFTKVGVPQTIKTSLSRFIKETSEFALSGSNASYDFWFDEDLLPVEIDRGQISQVINNILINSEQAMPEGGTIHISAENYLVDENCSLPLQPGNYVALTIHDEGPGISESNLSKIFDPYFSTKDEGSGLGLTICYSIIKKHGGHINVTSAENQGTSIVIFLPASFGIEESSIGEDTLFTGKGKVLLMDDKEDIRETVGEMLNYLGYDVDFAQDGSEAVAMYLASIAAGNPFDVVITDLTIPGAMGGKKAVQELLEINPMVKVIVSSGYSNDLLITDYRKYGFCAVVAKPYRLQELGKVLNDVLNTDLQ